MPFRQSIKVAQRRYPDFDRVLAAAKDFPISDAASGFLLQSRIGHDLAYYLARNPQVTAALARLDEGLQIAALQQAESWLSAVIRGVQREERPRETVH